MYSHSIPLSAAVQCSDGAMRLVNGTPDAVGVREGRLEICFQRVWGAVYDTNWTAVDAAVTCQELGFDPRGIIEVLCRSVCAVHAIGRD